MVRWQPFAAVAEIAHVAGGLKDAIARLASAIVNGMRERRVLAGEPHGDRHALPVVEVLGHDVPWTASVRPRVSRRRRPPGHDFDGLTQKVPGNGSPPEKETPP